MMLQSQKYKIGIVFGLLMVCMMSSNPSAFAQIRGAGNVKVKNETTGKTEDVKLYKASFALVIGESDYTNGWQKLDGVKTDVKAVSDALTSQGFVVTKLLNPKKSELVAAIEKFISDNGYDYENRLLIYYAGHGHTLKSGAGFEQGFIVPVDAPTPTATNEESFRRLSVSMDTIERYAQEINAKHALFVFDSCFSGALITKTRSGIPPIITTKTTQPVRQFITAGSDEQEVPDVSEFRKQFVLGFQGEADRNGDGFVTASELADFLQDKVTRYTRGAQTPQYGKIRDARLDKGDFVFIAPNKNNVSAVQNAPEQPIGKTKIDDKRNIENEAWNLIKDSKDANDFRGFLKDFPKGVNAPLAKIKLRQLETANKPNVKKPDNSANAKRISPPMAKFRKYSYPNGFNVEVPENWLERKDDKNGGLIAFVPDVSADEKKISHSLVFTIFQPTDAKTRLDINKTTENLVTNYLKINPGIQRFGDFKTIEIDGRESLFAIVGGLSQISNKTEGSSIIVTPLGNGKYFVTIFTIPTDEYDDFESSFLKILDSIRLKNN